MGEKNYYDRFHDILLKNILQTWIDIFELIIPFDSLCKWQTNGLVNGRAIKKIVFKQFLLDFFLNGKCERSQRKDNIIMNKSWEKYQFSFCVLYIIDCWDWQYVFFPKTLNPNCRYPKSIQSRASISQMDFTKTPQADDPGYNLREWEGLCRSRKVRITVNLG